MEHGDRRRAFRLFMRGALAGDVSLASRVGVHLSNGEGVRRDTAAALRWMHWAYRHGSSCDASNTAVTYAESGRWRLAAKWWARAVVSNDGDACVDLALCFLVGRGVRRQPMKARALLLQAVRMKKMSLTTQHGQEWAMALLGVMAASGAGTRRDLRAARKWLSRANADNDYPEAGRVLRQLGKVTPSPIDVARGGPWRVRERNR